MLVCEVRWLGFGDGMAHLDEFVWGDLEAEEADGGGYLDDVGDCESVEGLERELECG